MSSMRQSAAKRLNGLMALAMLVDETELDGYGVTGDYKLGTSSRRLDACSGDPPPAPRRGG
jgi:hypothetical protein